MSSSDRPATRRRALVVALAAYLALASLHTWPLVTDLGGLSRNDNADTMLNEWAIAWVAHALASDPLHLFDGNIFHPSDSTLAYSEPLIVPALLGAPLLWLGASPVLTYNALVVVGFVLTALAMRALVAGWTGDQWAGLVAGALFAFNAHLLTRLPHLQAVHAYTLPWALLALDRLVTNARTRDAVWLGLAVLAAALTSGYLLVIVTCALGAALLVHPRMWGARLSGPFLQRIGLAAVVTLSVGVVVLWPYVELQTDDYFRRPIDGMATFAATPWSYLTTTARLHYALWSHHIYQRLSLEALFPGVLALALCAAAFGRSPDGALSTRRRMLVAIAVIGFVLSLGSATPVYEWAYHLPLMSGIRATSRFGFLVMLAVSALAGLGLARLRSRWTGRWRLWAPIILLGAVTGEAYHGPLPFERYAGVPAIYGPLAADTEPGAVLELPIFSGAAFYLNAPYVLASTTHWRPLINGYSGYRPDGYDRLAQTVGAFPSDEAVERLRELDVRYVVLHGDRYPPHEMRRVTTVIDGASDRRDVQLVAVDGGDRLYRLLDPPGG